MIKLVIDMMGGDNGTKATIEAVQRLLNETDDLKIVAVGNEEELAVLKDRVKLIHIYLFQVL